MTNREIESLLVKSSPENLKAGFEKLLKDKASIPEETIRKAISKAVKESAEAEFKNNDDKVNYLTGKVIRKLSGCVSGSRVKDLISKIKVA